jgi:predicted Zn-dependent peptidase
MIAGILMLCDKNDGQKEVVILNEEAKPETKSIPEELIEYKKLLDQGIITQEEFDQKKRELLGL